MYGLVGVLLHLFVGSIRTIPAIVVGGLDHLVHIQLCTGVGGGEDDGAVRQGDHHIFLRKGIVRGQMQGVSGFLCGHATEIDAGGVDIVQNAAVIGGTEALDDHKDDQADQDHQDHGTNADDQELAVLGGFVPLGDLPGSGTPSDGSLLIGLVGLCVFAAGPAAFLSSHENSYSPF